MQTCSRCKKDKEESDFAVRTEKVKRKIYTYLRKVCRECFNERTREHWRKYRKLVFDHYGWVCKCCGETMTEFMSLDHINNDGHHDKNPGGSKKSGKELYLLVVKQNFPPKYQTLCMNCNWGKKVGNGKCPHETK